MSGRAYVSENQLVSEYAPSTAVADAPLAAKLAETESRTTTLIPGVAASVHATSYGEVHAESNGRRIAEQLRWMGVECISLYARWRAGESQLTDTARR